MKNLTSEQLLSEIKQGIKNYYNDKLAVNYSPLDLIGALSGATSGLDEIKAALEEWIKNRDELLVIIESADLESICNAYSKEGADADMIAKFESSIDCKNECQKYAFLSAINAII